jgi:16S rRNA (guanine1516-N2)-methyltransferase
MNHQAVHIKIEVNTADKTRIAEANLAKRICAMGEESKNELVLSFLDTHTELRRSDTKVGNGYFVDFSKADRRQGAGNLSKKQPLPKAIGLKNKLVVDATAGFCGDAIILTLMGFQVTAIERSPIISILLRDAMRRAKEDTELWDALGNKLQIIEGESKQLVRTSQNVDVIYIDTMFPKKKKNSPLPPGHIQLLSQIVGPDYDADILFSEARKTNVKRVVVKRPRYATQMSDDPVAVHKGKQVRYEVYSATP